MLLVLHNAEYQGTVSTDMVGSRESEMLARIFNVSQDFVYQHLTAEGRFNMLKAGVDFLLAYQEWEDWPVAGCAWFIGRGMMELYYQG